MSSSNKPRRPAPQILNLLGYAVVDVNMRGTGCSGGAFDYLERLQSLDGYDVVETVARQPWVLHNRVGMAGVSYGGISQLFVGATAPPHLAAITPLVGRGPRPRREARFADRGSALGVPADPERRCALQGESDAAHGGGGPDRRDPPQPLLPAQGRESALPRDLRPQDPRARLPGLPVRGRADRRPLRESRRPLHRDAAQAPATDFAGTDKPVWAFAETVPQRNARVTIALSHKHPSRSSSRPSRESLRRRRCRPARRCAASPAGPSAARTPRRPR
jgi:X-Pro dipeptidyl-peptidase (S15 family)